MTGREIVKRAHMPSEHPDFETLSLYAFGDLPLLQRLKMDRHIRRCAECEQQVLLFASAKTELRHDAGMQVLSGFEAIADWTAVERDMLGNIAVGVDAARCIKNVGRTRRLALRAAWAAGMAALFAGGWLTHFSSTDTAHLIGSLRRATGMETPAFSGAIVRSTPEGIAVKTSGATLTFLSPRTAVVSISGPSSVTARYIDDETGQVTITNVYGQ